MGTCGPLEALFRVHQRPAQRELLDSPEVQKRHRQIAEEHKGDYLHITCGLLAEDCTGLRGLHLKRYPREESEKILDR